MANTFFNLRRLGQREDWDQRIEGFNNIDNHFVPFIERPIVDMRNPQPTSCW